MSNGSKMAIISGIICVIVNLATGISLACEEKETRSFAQIDAAMKEREECARKPK